MRTYCENYKCFQMRVKLPSFMLLVYLLLTILSSEMLVGGDKMKKLVKYGFAIAPFAGMVGYGSGYGRGHGHDHGSSLGRSSKGKEKGKKKKKKKGLTNVFNLFP